MQTILILTQAITENKNGKDGNKIVKMSWKH